MPRQNLRASRATELADLSRPHVCAAWLGHTDAIAEAHYRMVRDEHFDKVVRNPVRAGGEPGRTEHKMRPRERVAAYADASECGEVGRAGFEPAKA